METAKCSMQSKTIFNLHFKRFMIRFFNCLILYLTRYNGTVIDKNIRPQYNSQVHHFADSAHLQNTTSLLFCSLTWKHFFSKKDNEALVFQLPHLSAHRPETKILIDPYLCIELISLRTTSHKDYLEVCLPDSILLSSLIGMWSSMKITLLLVFFI